LGKFKINQSILLKVLMVSESSDISIPIAQVIKVEVIPRAIDVYVDSDSNDKPEECCGPDCGTDTLCICSCLGLIICAGCIVGVPTVYSYIF
jgi:hypothetical protein